MTRLKRFQTEDLIKNERLYNEYHEYYRWVDGWDKDNKLINFYELMHLPELTGVPISGASVLDVGCGTGDLSLFLRKRGMAKYLGVDIYQPSLEKARKKYPQEDFRFLDILSEPISETFDYAFCSGTFTVRLSVDNYNFLTSMLEKIWSYTTVGVAFNLLTDDDMFPPDAPQFFYNIERVLKICRKIVKKGLMETRLTGHVCQSHFYLYR